MVPDRLLLTITGDADWIPEDGSLVGNHSIGVVRASSLDQLVAPTVDRPWDVVAFHVGCVRHLGGDAALAALRFAAPEATFLAVTDKPDVQEAIFYLKQGVYEYLEEPVTPATFLRALGEAVENRDAFREIVNLNHSLEAQRAQLVEEKCELERKNRELEAVSRVTRAVSSSLELDDIFRHLTRCIQETFGCERVMIGLLDPAESAEETLVVAGSSASGREDDRRPLRWLLKDWRRYPWIDLVLQRGRVLRVEDPAKDPLTKGTPLETVHGGPFVKIPMAARGHIVGSITIDNPQSHHRLGDEEMEVLGIFADASAMAVENARLYQTMRELSVRDELTGLFNRRHFLRQLDAEWNHADRHGTPVTLLMIDVDHFKSFNDLNDHLTGDAALRKISELLVRNTRGIDTVARYGGEEFVVLLPQTSKHSAAVVADKLRGAVADAPIDGEEALPSGRLSVSVGLAGFPGDATTPLELIEKADWALYQAKAGGRNRVVNWDGRSTAPN